MKKQLFHSLTISRFRKRRYQGLGSEGYRFPKSIISGERVFFIPSMHIRADSRGDSQKTAGSAVKNPIAKPCRTFDGAAFSSLAASSGVKTSARAILFSPVSIMSSTADQSFET